MAFILANGRQQYFDSTGNPLSGGFLWTMEPGPGVTTPKNTWSDAAQTALNTNPIVLNARGEAQVFWSGAYNVRLETAAGGLIYTVESISSGVEELTADLAELRADLANTANSALGDALIGVELVGSGVARTQHAKNAEFVTVTDYGADPTGVADSTAAFNLATKASAIHGGNDDLTIRREIYVPPGDFMIQGTVYVRKGQLLRGAGDGATRITAGVQTTSGREMFKMGYGIPGGIVTEDPGGLPPVVESLHTFGGDTNGGVIDMQVSGAQARNLFITSAGIGVRIGGGDTILANCIIDQGLNGVVIDGQNHIIDSCIFYNMNYGMTFENSTFDVQVNNSHFEYGIYDDILFNDSITSMQDVSIQNCQFVKNAQFATSDQSIHIRSTGADIFIHGCEFRNQRQYSIRIPTGLGNNLRVSNCIFDGARTNPIYDQSTTAAGIFVQNGSVEITNCKFENLFGNPVAVASTFDYPLVIKGCSYRNISTATTFLTCTATSGALTVVDCVGDGVLPLINLQSNIRPRLKNNVRWLGAAGNTGGRYFWLIPTGGAAIARVGIMANPAVGSNVLYKDISTVLAVRSVDWSGAVVQDVAAKSTVYETVATTLTGPLDIAVALDAVGGGSTAAYSTYGRYLAVSIPNTYVDIEIEADYDV